MGSEVYLQDVISMVLQSFASHFRVSFVWLPKGDVEGQHKPVLFQWVPYGTRVWELEAESEAQQYSQAF